MMTRRTPIPVLALLAILSMTAIRAADAPRPNIIWITSEDNGPHLGCYGDEYATTPNLDALAAKGLIYLNAWSTAPVCAPARTTLISGLYPPSTGSQHMRSLTRLPEGFKMYPQHLREAGYYCTNNSKEDYNLAKPGKVWDESSRNAHWKKRAKDQPFFAIFNHTVSHESQIRRRPHEPVHDASKVRVPAYHPDTPDVRRDWAQYHDKLTEMDARAGKNLRELEEAGLADDTIVFYYGDHGSGMPRNKRWTYDSGLHVPLIVYVPEKFKRLAPPEYAAGGKTDRLVGFIDLAPTLLSIVGIEPPEHWHGHAIMGEHVAPSRPYLHGFRDRMDERYDMVRSVRDHRYIYIRNYMPHKIYGQYIQYMFQTPTTRVWKAMFDAGKLTSAQAKFWQRKPPEELYDLKSDPDEVVNLAASAEHHDVLARLRKAQRDHALAIRDLGFLPEDEIHSRSKGSSPYELGRSGKIPLEAIVAMAERASSLSPDELPALVKGLGHEDSAARYWAAMGILMRGQGAVGKSLEPLRKALEDDSASVRVIAAEALGRFGPEKDAKRAARLLLAAADLTKSTVFVSMLALNALDAMDGRVPKVDGSRAALEALPKRHGSTPRRMGGYVPNLIRKTLADLE